MKKTWRNIIIISFVLIALELVGSLIFLAPYYKVQRVFDSINEGKWNEASDYYEKLNREQKDKVMSCLDSYAASICQKYIDGEITYLEAAASLDAINSIDETGTLFTKYSDDLNHNELKDAMYEYWISRENHNVEVTHKANERSINVQQRMLTEKKEKIMVEMLNEKYEEFLNEEISYEAMIAFSTIIANSAYYEAYDYSGVITHNALCVSMYRDKYNELVKMRDEQKYIDVIRICKEIAVDPKDKNYQDKIQALYNEAYELGKPYYSDRLKAFINADEKEKASSLMEELELVYGDDIDLTEIKETMLEDWQLAYLDFIDNMEPRFRADLLETETGTYIVENRYEKYKPDNILLKDINEDGIAEMFLFNSSLLDRNYVGCFIYTFDGSDIKYVGYANVISFGRDSYLIAFPESFTRSDGVEEYSLKYFDGQSLNESSSCQDMGGTYYVNYAEADEITYMSQRTIILGYQSEYNIKNSKYSALEDARKYIMSYDGER